MRPRPGVSPVFWTSAIFVACQALTLYLVSRTRAFLEETGIAVPEVSPRLPLVYFFAAVVLVGLVLFLIPVARLRIVLRVTFALAFAWGVFVVLGLTTPIPAAAAVAVAASIVWLFRPRLWLHDLLLSVSLVGVASTFGAMLSPWSVMAMLAALSAYDILAVRLGYMQWVARKMSESYALPALVVPRRATDWNLDLRQPALKTVFAETPAMREFGLLGGGDIGFPLLLVASVFFAEGLARSLVVALFSLLGLLGAYWIQAAFLRGRAMPALPPISAGCLAGLLIARLLV